MQFSKQYICVFGVFKEVWLAEGREPPTVVTAAVQRSTGCPLREVPGRPIHGQQRRAFRVSKQIGVVNPGSQRQAESSANTRIEEFEAEGYELVDQEIELGSDGMTLLPVFESDE